MKRLFLLLLMSHVSWVYAQFPATIDLGTLNGSDGFVLNGANGFDFTGYSTKSAGDINGDGLTDLIIGSDGAGSTGKVYLIFGKSTEYNSSYAVGDLVDDFGLVIENTDGGFDMGWSVDGLGDVNGDGIDDFIIGSPRFNSSRGKAYVIFGDMSGFVDGINIATLNGNNGFSLVGQEDGGQVGRFVTSAGDINHDGFPDIAVAAPFADSNGTQSGSVHVIYGTDNGFPAEVALNSLTSSTGFKLIGEIEWTQLGWHVTSLGDVNGDGIDDLGLSTSFPNLGAGFTEGLAYVLYGNASGFPVNFNMLDINGSNGFTIHNPVSGASSTIIYSAGDLNADGRVDISVGGRGVPNSVLNSYVLFGREDDFPAEVHLNNLGTIGFHIFNSDPSSDLLGDTSGTVGDINADGIDDLYISNNPGDSSINLGFIIFGSTSFNQNTFDLASLNGQNGFKIRGTAFMPFSFTYSWMSMAAMDDMNGDGINDFAIGNQLAETNGLRSGAVYVVFGREPEDLIFKNSFETTTVSDF